MYPGECLATRGRRAGVDGWFQHLSVSSGQIGSTLSLGASSFPECLVKLEGARGRQRDPKVPWNFSL